MPLLRLRRYHLYCFFPRADTSLVSFLVSFEVVFDPSLAGLPDPWEAPAEFVMLLLNLMVAACVLTLGCDVLVFRTLCCALVDSYRSKLD